MERVLAERYHLERVIGEGGMATVWRATDARLDRPVAVKIMGARFAGDDEFRGRFLREARAAASFTHPNVVDVLDYGEHDGQPFMVMELVDGEDLRTRLSREGQLAPAEVARIGAEVAHGLAAAHRRGLVHRDIKPANILIADDGTPKLADFGIVRALGTDTHTRAGMTLGSVHYLSPEQVQGTAVDARSDIYALGVVLYEAATGQRPFDGDAPAAIAVRRLHEAPRPPHAVEPSLPQWLSEVIERAMARDVARRYQSAADLERDLRQHRATARPVSDDTIGLPVPVTQPRAPVRARPGAAALPARQRDTALFFVALVAALALVGAGVFFVLNATTILVPNVVGERRDTAVDILRANSLNFVVLGPDENLMPAGRIYKQDPQPPSFVRFGDTVTIWVSGGPSDVIVPALSRRTLEEAKRALEDAGLKLGNTFQEHNEDVPQGRVIAADPPSGTRLRPGSTVNLILSLGPRPTPTPSPTPRPTPTPAPTFPSLPIPTPRR